MTFNNYNTCTSVCMHSLILQIKPRERQIFTFIWILHIVLIHETLLGEGDNPGQV